MGQGFLPPNIKCTGGTGLCSFTIDSKTRGHIRFVLYQWEAKIILINAPIYTEPWFHIADTMRPESMVLNLPPHVATKDFVVQWEMMIIRVLTNFKLLSLSMTNLSFAGTHLRKKLLIRFMVNLDTPTNFTPYPKTRWATMNFLCRRTMDAETTPLNVGQVIHSVQDGSWHDPATWSNNAVPTSIQIWLSNTLSMFRWMGFVRRPPLYLLAI